MGTKCNLYSTIFLKKKKEKEKNGACECEKCTGKGWRNSVQRVQPITNRRTDLKNKTKTLPPGVTTA